MSRQLRVGVGRGAAVRRLGASYHANLVGQALGEKWTST